MDSIDHFLGGKNWFIFNRKERFGLAIIIKTSTKKSVHKNELKNQYSREN